VSGVQRVIVLMEHTAQGGSAKLLRACTLPLTGARVVKRVITDLWRAGCYGHRIRSD